MSLDQPWRFRGLKGPSLAAPHLVLLTVEAFEIVVEDDADYDREPTQRFQGSKIVLCDPGDAKNVQVPLTVLDSPDEVLAVTELRQGWFAPPSQVSLPLTPNLSSQEVQEVVLPSQNGKFKALHLLKLRNLLEEGEKSLLKKEAFVSKIRCEVTKLEQSLCEHVWKTDGIGYHGSAKGETFYRCELCGMTENEFERLKLAEKKS